MDLKNVNIKVSLRKIINLSQLRLILSLKIAGHLKRIAYVARRLCTVFCEI